MRDPKPERPSPPEQASIRALSQGYSLLYELVSKQKDLSKLLLVKKEEPDVGAVIKEISQKSGSIQKQFEKFAKEDVGLNLKESGLPLIERKTRETIEKARAKELLLTRGPTFELHLLLDQVEALTYGAHLAGALRDSDTVSQQRRDYLDQVARQFEELLQRVVNLVSSRYGAAQKR